VEEGSDWWILVEVILCSSVRTVSLRTTLLEYIPEIFVSGSIHTISAA
jgi:hypothetical protein